MGGPMRCGSGGTPAGSLDGGKVKYPEGVGSALRQLLARSEIHDTRALVAASDALATFRVIAFPASATDASIESTVTKELPLEAGRMGVDWADVHRDAEVRTVFATAWDRSLVKGVTDAVRAAGVEPTVVDLKSACLARAAAPRSCVIVDLASVPIEIVVVEDHVPQLWRHHDLIGSVGDDLAQQLEEPLRAVLRFQSRRRGTRFGAESPVLLAADQVISSQVMSTLSQRLRHPVEMLPSPPRVPDIRYATYLTCLGLLMRRR
jgi:hypothetical protein